MPTHFTRLGQTVRCLQVLQLHGQLKPEHANTSQCSMEQWVGLDSLVVQVSGDRQCLLLESLLLQEVGHSGALVLRDGGQHLHRHQVLEGWVW